MNVEADIRWIQKELNKVKDPDLIGLFKQLLQFGKKNLAYTLEQYNNDIAQAEKDIETGKVYSQKQIEKLNEEWKKSL